MLVDSFTFFNELDLLEIRLNELSPIVDKFILVESNKTFSGYDKPLYFQENKNLYKEFLDKIIHIIVTDMPSIKNRYSEGERWVLDHHQRECINRGFVNLKDDDYIMISDVDEIININNIKNAIDKYESLNKDMCYFFGKNYIYYVNNIKKNCPHQRNSFISTLKTIKKFSIKTMRWACNKVKEDHTNHEYPKYCYINNGGWHFSFLGGEDVVKYKNESFAHSSYDTSDPNKTKLSYDYITSKSKIITDSTIDDIILPLDLPKYLINNRSRYRHLITKTPCE